ncbi:MAG: methyltransferase [Candidatus Sulfotelmatobacter sp.]
MNKALIGQASDAGVTMKGRQFYAFATLQIVLVGALLWWIFSRPGPWSLQQEIGAALVVAGAAGIALARYQLGKSFSLKAEARQLITHGLYSKIRNPIYVFGTLLFAGIVLFVQKPILWLVVVAVIIVQIIRARREARVLEATFGDAYREYERKTWL